LKKREYPEGCITTNGKGSASRRETFTDGYAIKSATLFASKKEMKNTIVNVARGCPVINALIEYDGSQSVMAI